MANIILSLLLLSKLVTSLFKFTIIVLYIILEFGEGSITHKSVTGDNRANKNK